MKTAIAATTALALATSASAISLSELDDFETSPTTLGWQEGGASPNPPVRVQSTANPLSGNRFFLRNVASGGFSAGGRQIMFNGAQWAGDYLTAGVSAINLDLRNSGATDLTVRLAFQFSTGARAATADALDLDAGSGWVNTTFDILDLVYVDGTSGMAGEDLEGVIQLRILAAESPAFRGDPIPSTLDADNILAVPAPGAAALFAGLAGLAGARRRR